jgi:hypothetical protein
MWLLFDVILLPLFLLWILAAVGHNPIARFGERDAS